MSQSKKNSFLYVLLSAGLLSLIGTVFGLFYNANHERQIKQNQFQNELTTRMLGMADAQERLAYADLLFSTGLLDGDQVQKDTLLYYINYQRGRQDAICAKSILGAIKLFYEVEDRVPYDMEELKQSLALQTAFDHFKDKVHYKASKRDKFQLMFPGADGHLYTQDDREYSFDDINDVRL